ncbi:MAG: WbqC family protein [Leptospiraceae bacterium]|nr:WbqC family protein [Leptospiraceae bacterium]
MKKIAILQSNYIPWKGYFDIIASVDEFILYDDMQYTKRDWRNRNKIKTPQGLQWLTIPVDVKGKFDQRICDTKVESNNWVSDHWKSLEHNYSKAKYYKENRDFLFGIYKQAESEVFLSKINHLFLLEVSKYLGIKSKITWSMDYLATGSKTERLISLCKSAGASHYLSGPSAKDYIKEDEFSGEGIQLEWMDYSGYPEYEQLYPPFEHGVSILDMIFNLGSEARRYFKVVK